jgi:hypothetical protein
MAPKVAIVFVCCLVIFKGQLQDVDDRDSFSIHKTGEFGV